jgi:hypothetical protein
MGAPALYRTNSAARSSGSTEATTRRHLAPALMVEPGMLVGPEVGRVSRRPASALAGRQMPPIESVVLHVDVQAVSISNTTDLPVAFARRRADIRRSSS